MLKIVLDGRGLTLTVQLLGRIAGRCGFCTETLALLTLGILALEESIAGDLVRLCNISAPFTLKYLWWSGLLLKSIVFLVLLLIPSSSCSYS